MATQISTSDWVLEIKSNESGSDICEKYSRSQLDVSKPLLVEGQFRETEEIRFTYRLTGTEKNCSIQIPGCHDRITRENSGDAQIFTYCWRPVNFAGIFNVVFEILTAENKQTFSLCLDVLSKFDQGSNNHNNYYYLLNSLREKHFNIYKITNPSQVKEKYKKSKPPTPLEKFDILKRNMKKLENAVYQISLNPNKKLLKETHRDAFFALDVVDHNIILDIATQGGGIVRAPSDSIAPALQNLLTDTSGNRYLPETVIVYRTASTFNVFENQLLKRFLTLIALCSKQVESEFVATKKNVATKKGDKLNKTDIDKLDQCIEKSREFYKKAQYMKTYSFLDGVRETDEIAYNTPVLQREVNYMRFHDIFKDFMKMPFMDFSDYHTLKILDIPTLYEYWAVIQIVDILTNMQTEDNWSVNQHIITKNEFGYLFRLNSGNNSLIELYNDEVHVSLYYQKEYPTYFANRNVRPDVTLEIQVNGKLSKILVFDPKYRSTMAAGDLNDPENAINKMHVYKDAIRGEDGSHIVEAAYAIYLGKTQINYSSHDGKDGIGGIGLVPKENCIAKGVEKLKEIINLFINKTY